MRRFLVGLDGSELAEQALALAEDLARASNGTLILVRAVPSGETLESFDETNANVFRYNVPTAAADNDPLTAREVAVEARLYVDGVATRLRESGIRVDAIAVAGDPADVIIEEVGLRHPDAIILTTHGRSGLGRWIYGSVAETVLSRSSIPVLLVRAGMPQRKLADADGSIRLLVPLDGSPAAEEVLPWATNLAKSIGGELFLTRIIPSAPSSLTHEKIVFNAASHLHPADKFERAAESYVQQVAHGVSEGGIRVQTAVGNDYPPAGILAAADACDAALIVMTTHGRTGLGRTLLGSVAMDVLRQGTHPVFLVRHLDDADEEEAPQEVSA